jgi:hypothetical protein
MNTSKDTLIKTQTKNWIESFIIEYNICPFAKHVVDKGGLQIEVVHDSELDAVLDAVFTSLERLDNQSDIETMLLIFPSIFSDFFDYLDFVALVENELEAKGYEGVYQIATFHPDYCFSGVPRDDVSNYTNRSPYPMVHLLRESSIDKGITFYGETEEIPKKNISTMHSLGLKKVMALLKKISS